jgi:hypothetical protein
VLTLVDPMLNAIDGQVPVMGEEIAPFTSASFSFSFSSSSSLSFSPVRIDSSTRICNRIVWTLLICRAS